MPDILKQNADIRAQIGALGQEPIQTGEPPTLPPLPKQESMPDISTGAAVARALSVFMAGMNDPSQAVVMMQHFTAQDLAAKQEAQIRFQNAVTGVQAERENIQFGEAVKGQRVQQQLDIRGQKLRGLEAMLQSLQLEIAATQDPNRKEHLMLTLGEVQKLAEAQTPAGAKPLQYKNPLEAMVGLGSSPRGQELMNAIKAGKGAEYVQGLNQSLVENAPAPKAIFPKSLYDQINSMPMDPAARAYWQIVASTAPDPVSGPGTPGEASQFGATLRQMTPEDHDLAVKMYAEALYNSGQVPSIQAAYEVVADVESGMVDPTDLAQPGTYKVTPLPATEPAGPPAPKKSLSRKLVDVELGPSRAILKAGSAIRSAFK